MQTKQTNQTQRHKRKKQEMHTSANAAKLNRAAQRNRPAHLRANPHTPSKTYTVGIDLGGTKVAAALVNESGQIISEVRMPTVPPWLKSLDPREGQHTRNSKDVRRHIDYVVQAMVDAAAAALRPLAENPRLGRLAGIGLASAGPMNVDLGTLENPSNFMGWKRVQIVSLLQDALIKNDLIQRVVQTAGLELNALTFGSAPLSLAKNSIASNSIARKSLARKSLAHGAPNELRSFDDHRISPIKVGFQNDAIAAALGEGWVGHAKSCQTYIMITVGTGIGTGVIFNGRPAQSRGMGSEWGHLLVNHNGLLKDFKHHYERSVEGLASGTGLIRLARAAGLRVETASDLAEAARSGHPTAIKLFNGAAEALASLFVSLSLGFHPEVIVISGGMMALRDQFLPQAADLYRQIMKDRYPEFLAPVRISKLGTQAGVIGAARLPLIAAND